MISTLHYISQETFDKSHVENIREACRLGIDWVQLRVKDKSQDEIEEIAFEAKSICKKFGAKLIINDHVEIAKAVKANGVHLGKNDMNPIEAREILGDKPYIGGTANTWDDVVSLNRAGVDYIGLGPFKFTETKENLSPILGIKGYSTILNNMIISNIDTPIIAIGGITIDDIFDIQMTGCHGVAVASLINEAPNKELMVEEIKSLLPNTEFGITDHSVSNEIEDKFNDLESNNYGTEDSGQDF
ncbi:thiamine phosphate synthase [Reichenbachiella versicolor]|uniref:thiamine phosphate synthase n=1 Tax=Reichenbachiella versicolor TaxID=1821036 RepID=UPI000D6DDDA2|nr:thiamine phosphate synthase [Reichenbachiella versicolor]